MKEQLVHAIADMREEEALRLVHALLDAGADPYDVLDAGREAMAIVGQRYEDQEYFLPELIIAGDVLKQLGDVVKPRLRAAGDGGEPAGKVVIGTVAGDIHDLGKDVVSFMLEVNNFQVIDLGVDVSESKFIKAIREHKPEVVGLSGFLTLAFEQMKVTVDAISKAGLRDKVRIMIGGAIMDENAAKYVGADAYGKDATAAVRLAQGWTGGK